MRLSHSKKFKNCNNPFCILKGSPGHPWTFKKIIIALGKHLLNCCAWLGSVKLEITLLFLYINVACIFFQFVCLVNTSQYTFHLAFYMQTVYTQGFFSHFQSFWKLFTSRWLTCTKFYCNRNYVVCSNGGTDGSKDYNKAEKRISLITFSNKLA